MINVPYYLSPRSHYSLSLSLHSLLWILGTTQFFRACFDQRRMQRISLSNTTKPKTLSLPKKTWILRKKKHFEIFDKSSFRIQLLLTLDVTISVQTCTQVSRTDGPTRPPSQSSCPPPQTQPALIISFFPQPQDRNQNPQQ